MTAVILHNAPILNNTAVVSRISIVGLWYSSFVMFACWFKAYSFDPWKITINTSLIFRLFRHYFPVRPSRDHQCTISTLQCLLYCICLLNHQMVDQNLFKAVLRPFSLAAPDSSLAWVFVTFCLACPNLCWFQSLRDQKGSVVSVHKVLGTHKPL